MDLMEGAIPIEDIKEKLERTKNGVPRNTLRNCALILRHDPVLYGKFRFNILAQCVSVAGTVPWERPAKGTTLANSDLRALHLYIEDTYGITSEKFMDEALYLVADENRFHPVRDYLDSLPAWDGQERIRYALHHFLGADCSDYTYELLSLFMKGAIARAFHPGIKFDYMLCLVGGQGAGKSSFFRVLCVNDEWFCDDLRNLEAKDVFEKMQGHWIIEMSEMTATINAKTNEAIKSFLSRQKETFRTPYDRIPEDRPRQCVFAGTTNKLAFLPNDRTGNRRFLPILCCEEEAEVFILEDEATSRDYVDLMWAEALQLYRKDPMNLKLSPEMEAEVRIRQQMFITEDVDAGMILAFMQETKEDKVCSRMLFSEALGNGDRQPLRWQTNDICEIMGQLIASGRLSGWRAFNSPKRFRDGYGTQRGWERIPDTALQDTVGDNGSGDAAGKGVSCKEIPDPLHSGQQNVNEDVNRGVNKDVNRQLTIFDNFIPARPEDDIPFLKSRFEVPPLTVC